MTKFHQNFLSLVTVQLSIFRLISLYWTVRYSWSFDSIHFHCHEDGIIFHSIHKEFQRFWANAHLRGTFWKNRFHSEPAFGGNCNVQGTPRECDRIRLRYFWCWYKYKFKFNNVNKFNCNTNTSYMMYLYKENIFSLYDQCSFGYYYYYYYYYKHYLHLSWFELQYQQVHPSYGYNHQLVRFGIQQQQQ
jgi:hypothetical protein